jgi:hypothetical protein
VASPHYVWELSRAALSDQDGPPCFASTWMNLASTMDHPLKRLYCSAGVSSGSLRLGIDSLLYLGQADGKPSLTRFPSDLLEGSIDCGLPCLPSIPRLIKSILQRSVVGLKEDVD